MTEIAEPIARPRSLKTGRTILALILREMQTTYGRSPGGYLWAILEPVGAIAIFTLVISAGLKIRTPGLGSNFALFYATGFLPFSLAMSMANRISQALNFSKPLLFYPGVRFTDAIAGRFLLFLLTHILVFFIIMFGIHFIFELSTIRNLPAIAGSIALSALFGLSLGTLNCFLFSVSPLWGSAFNILTRPLFLLSCVLYTFEDVPRQYQEYLWYNPLVHVIGLMRHGFYSTYDANYVSVSYVLGLSLVMLFFGLLLLSRYHREIINR